jgi:hypothetical protein
LKVLEGAESFASAPLAIYSSPNSRSERPPEDRDHVPKIPNDRCLHLPERLLFFASSRSDFFA